MVHLLYAVAAFVCALVVLILPARTRSNMSKKLPLDKAFLRLANWIVLFCAIDGIWGIAASESVINDNMLRVASFFFHLSAAITPLVWLYFVLTYAGKDVKLKPLYVTVSVVLFIAEVVLLIMNFWNEMIFYVDTDNTYKSGPWRQFLFYAQYINYVILAIVALIRITGNARSKSHQKAILAFVAAPILCGFFQLLYPDAPAYSIGYMLGFCIIYSFVVTDMLEERMTKTIEMSKASKAKTAFLNSMSHDIRTPLNAITGFNNMALKALGKDEEKVRSSLLKIGRSSDALLTIINDILEISRIEAGKVTLSEDKGDLTHIFANIESMLMELASKSDIKLQISFGNIEDRYIIGDFGHCGRVFTNLIGNAIKYTPKGGNVWVTCEQTEHKDNGTGIYRFTFKDNGIGISEEFQQKLFQPFSREATSTVSKIQGTGLGLALSMDLVTLMGGKITCKSRQGEGSTFTVTLPFKIQEGQENQIAKAAAQTTGQFLADKKILLVEDNDLNREIATEILTEYGAKVTSAEDGSIAVEMMSTANRGDYDIILMDVQMPKMNGYEATRKIRAMGKDIPIIAMTANAFEEDRQIAFEAGMNEHIAKPINIAQLETVLKQFLTETT